MTANSVPRVLQAIEALKRGDRRGGAELLAQDLNHGAPSPDRCRTISRLAAEIGEIDTAIEASRRSLSPPTLERMLAHWALLATHGHSDEAIAEIERLDATVRDSPAVLHFRGTIAGESGRFAEAEELFRRALAKVPESSPTWFSLSMIKTFEPGDRDIDAMEAMARNPGGATSPNARSQISYALGKAYDECGDFGRAFESYRQGAAIRRQDGHYDVPAASAAADRVIRDFTPETLRKLRPSQLTGQRSLFVTGLPRSGTTLVQQLLTAHSRVIGGDEVNLLKPALLPTLDFTYRGAIAYQERAASDDPWGDIARDYDRFITMRFREPGLVVDKSLGQSTLIGFLLHSLPDAKIVWLRRNAEDAALSCFRTSFTAATHWSWSIADIADHFRIEDRLFEHWRSAFADRILVVPYEDMVKDPGEWISAIAEHVGLDAEGGMERFHESDRTVRTASVKQVRSPVTTDRIGAAGRYPLFSKEFDAVYRR
ncbi:MAG: sulfotransferase [Sphingomicrobium sp.]